MPQTPPTAARADFDFLAAVQESVRDYPLEMQRTFFLDAATRQCVFDTAEPAMKHSLSSRSVGDILDVVLTPDIVACVLPYTHDHVIMAYRRAVEEAHSLPDAHMCDAYIFDHELGHLVVSGAFTKNRLNCFSYIERECRADAFAAIRHIQRFGSAEHLAHLAEKLCCAYFMDGQSSHLTASVVEAIRSASEVFDFSSLSPAQTSDIAEKFAVRFAPSPQELESLEQDYVGILRKLEQDPGFIHVNELQQCLEKLEPGNFSYVVGASAIKYLMTHYPEQFTDRKCTAPRVEKTPKAQYQDILVDFIQNKQGICQPAFSEAPEKSHIFRVIPLLR